MINRTRIAHRSMKVLSLFLAFFSSIVSGSFWNYANSQEGNLPGNQYVSAALVLDLTHLQPPQNDAVRTARVGVHLKISPGWHIYWRNSGESGMPTRVTWKLPAGWKTGELTWPTPLVFKERGNITTIGYDNETLLFADLFAPSEIPVENQVVELGAFVSFLVCKDICVPGESSLKETYSFSTSSSLGPSPAFPLFQSFESLTAHPWSTVKNYPLLQNTTLTTFLDPPKSLAGLIISNLPLAAETPLSDHIQIFPYHVTHKNPMLRILSPTDILISLPTESLRREAPALTGEIVLSPMLTGTPEPLALSWTISEQTSLAPNKAAQYLATAVQSQVLSYRVVDHALEKQVPPSLNNQGASHNLMFALLSALIAGLLLNLMPCVLPVISIKVLGFVKRSGQSKSDARSHALFFTAGILLSFLALAILVISLRTAGIAVGWGFQFQEPMFVFGLLLVTFVFSLGFFDLIVFQFPFLQTANRHATKLPPGWRQDLFDGVLATLLSTPCTAPFLGPALAFSFTESPPFTVLIFCTIGLGLALPYAFLVTHPKLRLLLPKPGPWMGIVKQLMGFSLLGTSVWLLFVLERTTSDAASWVVALLLSIFFVVWANRQLKTSHFGSTFRHSVTALLLLALIIFGQNLLPRIVATEETTTANSSSLISWVPFSPMAIADAKKNKLPVFLVFTADWCVTCKVNEQLVIETLLVAEALKKYQVTPIKADWTLGDGQVGNALTSYGAYGVPLYVYIPRDPERKPIIFPTIITAGTLLETFAQDSPLL